MFQFTTTNVINSDVDLTTGKPLWSKQTATDTECASVNIKRIGNFKEDFVTAVYKAEASDPEMAKAVIDFSTISGDKGDPFRLNMFIGLTEGSNYSLYANDSYYKGRPLVIDFTLEDSAVDTVAKLVKMVKKYLLAIAGEKIVNITDAGNGKLSIEAVTEYQRFLKLNIEKLIPEALHGMGDFKVVKSLEDLTKVDSNADAKNNEFFIGKEGQGTYSWLLHNLRLPTPSRTTFMGMNHDETPIIGAKYTQYTVHYCVNRGSLGLNAVGHQVTSHTTHVFYIKEDLAEDFEDALSSIATQAGGIQTIPAETKKEVEKPGEGDEGGDEEGE